MTSSSLAFFFGVRGDSPLYNFKTIRNCFRFARVTVTLKIFNKIRLTIQVENRYHYVEIENHSHLEG